MSNFHISLLEWQSRSQAVMERGGVGVEGERGPEESWGLKGAGLEGSLVEWM